MKKLLLATLCASSLTLVACDKKPQETTTASEQSQSQSQSQSQNSLSQHNLQDIKSDLTAIQAVSNKKAQEGLDYQSEAIQALQTGKQDQVLAVVGKMQSYVDGFNQSLKELQLKSNEADELRNKIIQSNTVGFELAKEGASKTPDANKINQLKEQLSKIQNELVSMMQTLQAQVHPEQAQKQDHQQHQQH